MNITVWSILRTSTVLVSCAFHLLCILDIQFTVATRDFLSDPIQFELVTSFNRQDKMWNKNECIVTVRLKKKKGRGHWFQFDAYNNMSGSGRWSTCMAYSGIRHIHNKTTTPCTNLRGNLKTKLKSVTVAYIKEKNTYIKYIKNC